MKIRSYVILLVAGLLLPQLFFSVFMIFTLQKQELATLERGMRDTARALTAALDRELQISIHSLKVLAASDHLRENRLSPFYQQMNQGLRAHKGRWANLNLVDASGQQLINLRMPFGAALPRTTDLELITRVLDRAEPAISNLVPGPVTGVKGFVLAVPVFLQGGIKYTLNAVIYPEVLSNLLGEQKLPPTWIVSILDGKKTIVARTHSIAELFGTPASPSLIEAASSGEEGSFRGVTRDNISTYTAFSRSRLSGWTVAIGAPVHEVEAPIRRSLWVSAATGSLFLFFALVGATFVARRITGSVTALSRMARAVGFGHTPSAETSQILELDEVGRELEAAAGNRKRAENAVRRERDFSDAALNSLPGVFCVIDREGALIRWNMHLAQLMGYTAETIENNNLLNVFADADKDSVAECIRAGFEQGSCSMEVEIVCKKGDRIPYYFTGRRAEVDGHQCMIGVGIDIAERKRAERELHEAHLQLEAKVRERTYELTEANVRLKDLDRLKTDFLANMSHELRTPLNGVIGFSQLLVDEKVGPVNPEQREYLCDILLSAEHLLQLINDILDLSKIEAGKMALNFDSFSVNAAVTEVCNIIAPFASKCGVRIRVEPILHPDIARLDQLRFRQIVYNLVSNAAKFSYPDQEVLVTVEHAAAGNFRMKVTDSGIGIRSEDLPLLFQSFQQLQSGLSRRHTGTGLGLALTKKIVELHKGSIHVESNFGEGTMFSVELPMDATV